MSPASKALILLLFLALQGCDFSGSVNVRSGSMDDDYLEEPLNRMVERYQTAPTTSNNILDMISKSQYPDIYRIYFSDSMKAQMTGKEFIDLMNQVKHHAGPLSNFKHMQWNFFTGEEQGMNLLYSVKIAEHENSMMKYLFVFDRDKPYIDLVGFYVKQRQGVSTPGQF